MASSQSDQPQSGLRAVLDGIQQWAGRYLDDASPAQVGEVLAVSAFLVGLNMGWANPAQAAALLRQTAEDVPSVSAYTRALADDLARLNGEPAGDDRPPRKGPLSVDLVAASLIPPFLLN